jgi:hypothetical protein
MHDAYHSVESVESIDDFLTLFSCTAPYDKAAYAGA